MNGPKTVIDIIEEEIGCKLNHEFLKNPKNVTQKMRMSISESYRSLTDSDSFNIHVKEKNEVFPYIHHKWKISEDFGAWRDSLHDMDSIFSNIKSLLLYFHRIALPDGFRYLLGMYLYDWQSSDDDHKQFLKYLYFFAEYRELINRGIICFIPLTQTNLAKESVMRLHTVSEWYELEDKLLSSGEYGNYNYIPTPDGGVLRVSEYNITDIRCGGNAFLDMLKNTVEESLFIGNKYNLDLFLPSKKASKFFDYYRHLLTTHICKSEIQEATLGSMLLVSELPSLSNVSINNIISIRKSGEGFSVWRARLRDILSHVYEDYLNDDFSPEFTRKYADEALAEGRIAIYNEIQKSNYLSLTKSATRSVGIGLANGFLLPSSGIEDAIIKSTGAAAITFLWDYISQKISNQDTKSALRAHYSVFSNGIE